MNFSQISAFIYPLSLMMYRYLGTAHRKVAPSVKRVLKKS
jgi:hypothetical protein